MRNVALYIFLLPTVLASGSCIAASSLVAVYQISEYPIPGKPYTHPPGLLFEACDDGSVYRAVSTAKGSRTERGVMSKSALKDFRAGLEKEWLAPVRAECKAHGMTLDSAYLRIESTSSTEIDCIPYEEGKALKGFEAKFWALQLENLQPTESRQDGVCN